MPSAAVCIEFDATLWPAESERFTDGVEEVFLEGEDEDDDVPLGIIGHDLSHECDAPTKTVSGGEFRGKCWKNTRRTNDHFKMRTVKSYLIRFGQNADDEPIRFRNH